MNVLTNVSEEGAVLHNKRRNILQRSPAKERQLCDRNWRCISFRKERNLRRKNSFRKEVQLSKKELELHFSQEVASSFCRNGHYTYIFQESASSFKSNWRLISARKGCQHSYRERPLFFLRKGRKVIKDSGVIFCKEESRVSEGNWRYKYFCGKKTISNAFCVTFQRSANKNSI